MKKILTVLFALILTSISTYSLANVYMLEEAKPILVPAGTSKESVKRAIIQGMAFRGWIPTVKGPNEIKATIHVRTHIVMVSIKYDETVINITYLDSVNMGYEVKEIEEDENYYGIEKPVPHIHKAYHNWVANLARDIRAKLPPR